jgi:hypothetical protein
LEATAVALALKGAASQWPARFVFKVLDKLARWSETRRHRDSIADVGGYADCYLMCEDTDWEHEPCPESDT